MAHTELHTEAHTEAHDGVILPTEPARELPAVRSITPMDLVDVLAKGLADFRAMPTHVIFLSLIYPVAGFVIARWIFGYDMLPLLYPLLAGFALIGLGVARLGKAIEFIPYPVTTGFTSGIAVVIATLQVKDFLGLDVPQMPDEYLERAHALWNALPTWKPHEFAVGLATLLVIVFWPKVTTRVPAGSASAVGPETSVTSAPRRAATEATA